MTVQDSPSLSTVTSFDWSSWNRPRTTHMACIVRFSSWNANAEVFSSRRIHSGVSSLASGAFPFGGIVNFMSFIICLRREKRGQFLMFLLPVINTANLRMALEGGTHWWIPKSSAGPILLPTNCYPQRACSNADAHLKRQIMGREVVVAITKGEL